MIGDIIILEEYPNCDICETHNKDITHFCNNRGCPAKRLCCKECLSSHKNHTIVKCKEKLQKIAKLAYKNGIQETERSNMIQNFQEIFNSFKDVRDRLKGLVDNMDKFEKEELIRLKLYYEGLAFDPSEIYKNIRVNDFSQKQWDSLQDCVETWKDLDLSYMQYSTYTTFCQEKVSACSKKIENKIVQLEEELVKLKDFSSFQIDKYADWRARQNKDCGIQVYVESMLPEKKSEEKQVDLSGKGWSDNELEKYFNENKATIIAAAKINLEDNKLTDAGFKKILDAVQNTLPNLQNLNLRKNKLKDQAIDILQKSSIPNLQNINLKDNNINFMKCMQLYSIFDTLNIQIDDSDQYM